MKNPNELYLQKAFASLEAGCILNKKDKIIGRFRFVGTPEGTSVAEINLFSTDQTEYRSATAHACEGNFDERKVCALVKVLAELNIPACKNSKDMDYQEILEGTFGGYVTAS
jgi:hypothetical protein